MFLACNLIEIFNLRSNLLEIVWEKKIISKIYKSQLKYLSLPHSKYETILNSKGLDLSNNIGKKNTQ
jgi:hypothetical protein